MPLGGPNDVFLKEHRSEMNQGNECDCEPEMREIKGVWVPSHAPSCTRGSLEGFVMAEGEFMDEFGKAGNDH